MLSITVAFDFEVEQMDEKTTFLHGDRRINIYEATKRICCEGKEGTRMQTEKVLVWFKTITKDVVSKF